MKTLFWFLFVLLTFTACDSITSSLGPDTTAPADVTHLAAAPGNGSVALSWTDPGDADFASVRISSPGLAALSVPRGTSARIVGGLTNGAAYTFLVQSVDQTGNRSTGVAVTSTPVGPPANVSGLKAVPGNSELVITWTDPADVAFDHVIITVSGGGTVAPLTIPKGVQTATITGLTNGTAFTVLVQSANAAGTGLSVGASTVATPVAPTTPTGPTNAEVHNLLWAFFSSAFVTGLSTAGAAITADAQAKAGSQSSGSLAGSGTSGVIDWSYTETFSGTASMYSFSGTNHFVLNQPLILTGGSTVLAGSSYVNSYQGSSSPSSGTVYTTNFSVNSGTYSVSLSGGSIQTLSFTWDALTNLPGPSVTVNGVAYPSASLF